MSQKRSKYLLLLGQDIKTASNRLRAEVAAARQESIELSQLRKEVETSLRQLRHDIESAGEAKKEPLAVLRAEVQLSNRGDSACSTHCERSASGGCLPSLSACQAPAGSLLPAPSPGSQRTLILTYALSTVVVLVLVLVVAVAVAVAVVVVDCLAFNKQYVFAWQ